MIEEKYIENVKEWLEAEAEKLEKEKVKLKSKILKTMENKDLNSIDKINQYNIRLKAIGYTQMKLYEIMGRTDEIKKI